MWGWCSGRRQPIISLAMAVACACLFADRASADDDKTVTVDVFANVETFVTHETEINVFDCTPVGPGKFEVVEGEEPQHGEVSTDTIPYTDKKPQPCAGKTFLFATVYYKWTDTRTTDRQDHFTVHWTPPPSSSSPQPFDVVVTIALGPRIIFQGKDITNTNQTVALGQRIVLTTAPTAVGQTQSWSGDLDKKQTVGGYTTGAKGEVQPADLTKSTTKFFWITPATKNVTYTVHADGKTGTAQAIFEVQGPVGANVATKLGFVQIANNELTFGIPGDPGITFTEMAGQSPQAGQFLWAQLIESDDVVVDLARGAKRICTIGLGLDNSFPYSTGASTSDSPATPHLKTTWTDVSHRMVASMFLLWQSSNTGSIPVPLGSVNWSWFGAATYDSATGIWSLKNSSKVASPFRAGSQFPLWSKVVTNGKLNCY